MSILGSLLRDLIFTRKTEVQENVSVQSSQVRINPLSSMRRVLNVGGNNKTIPLPEAYEGFEHWLLDIDPKGNPDILCDARELTDLEPGIVDAVYCSHNLEHYYRHDVPKVLAGFLHVLRAGGVAHIRVPDMGQVMRAVVERELDIDDVLYQSPSGPIDGYRCHLWLVCPDRGERAGFFCAQNGVYQQIIAPGDCCGRLRSLFFKENLLEIEVLAFKGVPDSDLMQAFGLPEGDDMPRQEIGG
jgi:hypothetical protein